jgi:DNA-binding CsgD family transcriptional regulator
MLQLIFRERGHHVGKMMKDKYRCQTGFIARGSDRLTDNEKKAVYYLLQGLNTRGIGDKLGKDGVAVENIFNSVRNKFGVKTRVELVALFFPSDREFRSEQLDSLEDMAAQLLIEGKSYDYIAEQLGFTPASAQDFCSKNVYKKLGLGSRIELASFHYRELLRNP